MHVIRTRGPEISGEEMKAVTSGELMTNGSISIRWVPGSSGPRPGPEQETLVTTPGVGTAVSTEDGPQLFLRLDIFMPK